MKDYNGHSLKVGDFVQIRVTIRVTKGLFKIREIGSLCSYNYCLLTIVTSNYSLVDKYYAYELEYLSLEKVAIWLLEN